MTDDLQLPMKFVIKDKEEFKKDVLEYLKHHRRLKPVRFGYTVEYAESLEYGTGPLDQYQPTVHGGDYSYATIYKEIYDWQGKKQGDGLPIKDPGERQQFARNVTKKFFRVGMRPHPYWRPALQFLEDNEQRLFDEGMSFYNIQDEQLRVQNKCIMDQNLPFTGKLQQSAIIEEVDPDGSADFKDRTRDEQDALFDKVGWS